MVGLAGRAVLAFWVFPGQGFAGDMASFLTWSRTIARTGPGGFYAAEPSANYPPVSILMFWGLEAISHPLAPLFGGDVDRALLVLLKLPAIVADAVVGVIVYALGSRWRGRRVGLVGAALYLVVPQVWYVSALWGQIDAVLTMFTLGALAALVNRRTYLATVLSVGAVLVKPQGVLVVLVVGVVLLASLLRRDGAGRRHVGRLVGSVVAALVVALALLVPFGYESLAGAGLRTTPVLGDVAGFVAQSVGTSRLFPVLTADAYNPWALVGEPTLARTLSTGTAVWNVDAIPFLGATAGVVGLVALAVALVLVLVGLVVRHDLPAVLLAYTVASYALFVLPTRVHERYLLPAFATGVVLAAPALWRVLVFVVASALHTVNLHAILAPGLRLTVRDVDGSTSPVGGGGPPAGGGGFDGARPPGGGQPPRGGGGSVDSPQDLPLPFTALTRSEWVVQVVSIGQAVVLAGLLVAWVVTIARSARARVNPPR